MSLDERIQNVKKDLKPLREHGVSLHPLKKYYSVVNIPRNSLGPATTSQKAKTHESIQNLSDNTDLNLYVHTPFCTRECTFCKFMLERGLNHFQEQAETFVEAVEDEARILGEQLGSHDVSSLYLGGGSPSLLQPSQLETILNSVEEHIGSTRGVETTIELHPEIQRLQPTDYLNRLEALGINRVSIGYQSRDQDLLTETRRGHRVDEAKQLLENLRDYNFTTNVDIMYGFKDQTPTQLQRTLNDVQSFEPDTISTYFLEIRRCDEPYEAYKALLNDETYLDKAVEMDVLLREQLEAAGRTEETFSYWSKQPSHDHMDKKWADQDTALLSLGPGTYNWVFQGNNDNPVFYKPFTQSDWQARVEQGTYPVDRAKIHNEDDTQRRHAFFGVKQGSLPKSITPKHQGIRQNIEGLLTTSLMQEENDTYALTEAGRTLKHGVAATFTRPSYVEKARQNMTSEETRYTFFPHPDYIRDFQNLLKKSSNEESPCTEAVN